MYVALLVHFTRLTLRAVGMAYNTAAGDAKQLAAGLGYTKLEEREIPDKMDAKTMVKRTYEVPDVSKVRWYIRLKVFGAQFLAN